MSHVQPNPLTSMNPRTTPDPQSPLPGVNGENRPSVPAAGRRYTLAEAAITLQVSEHQLRHALKGASYSRSAGQLTSEDLLDVQRRLLATPYGTQRR